MSDYKTEDRDGMRIDWGRAYPHGRRRRSAVRRLRPQDEGKYPVIMTYGPYGKYLHFEDLYETCWTRMVEEHPDVPAGSTNKYQNWEVVDPEKWVPDGYAVVRVDSRGAGRSPGVIDIWSAREAQDFYQCIEWAAVQPWSTGKIGLNGISYYGMNQWQVGELQPPHLTAMCVWEGRPIITGKWPTTAASSVTASRATGPRCRSIASSTGAGSAASRAASRAIVVSGPPTLTEEELGANRNDFGEDCFSTSSTPTNTGSRECPIQ